MRGGFLSVCEVGTNSELFHPKRKENDLQHLDQRSSALGDSIKLTPANNIETAESEDGMTRTDKVFADGLRVDLFAGFPVSEYATSAAWYERLLGCPPAFLPNEVEAVWELAEHRYIFIKFQPEHAGHAFNLFFLSDLDGFIAQIAKRGLNPATHETLANGVRRVTYSDPDGNVVGFGGAL